MKTLALATVLALACLPPWALAQTAAPTAAQDPHLARNLAATCANCHGTNGQARGDIRPLAGLPADRIIATMGDYKRGTLPATIMHQIAKGYTDDQIRLVAGYFAAQPAGR